MNTLNVIDLENYSPTKHTIGIVGANLFSILLLATIAVPILLLFAAIAGLSITDVLKGMERMGLLESIVLLALIIAGIFAHELLHAVFFARYAKNGWKAISFGILKKYLSPYCHCSDPVLLPHYILAALAPTVVLGCVPIILAIALLNSHLLLFGLIFVTAGTGDILLVVPLLREARDCYILDLEDEAGYLIYRRTT